MSGLCCVRAVALGAAMVAGPSTQAQETVVIASFGSLWQEVLEEALAPWAEENNVEVRFTAGSSTDNVTRAIAARNNPDVDIVMGEEMSFTLGVQEGIFEKLDPSIVANLDKVVDEAIMADAYGVGIIMQNIGLFYHTENFQKEGWDPPSSWMELVDEQYCGRVGYMHPNVSFGYYALMMIGGGKAEGIHTGIDRVVAFKDCVETVDPSGAKHVERAQLGDFDVGVLAHQLVISLADRGAPLEFVTPEEGGILQFTTMAIAKDAPNPELAQRTVNELLSERVQRILVEQFKASPVNKEVAIPAELIAAGAPDPDHMERYLPIDAPQLIPQRKELTEQFMRAMAE